MAMIYEFESRSGHRIEEDWPMSEAPPVGHVVIRDGVLYIRTLPTLAPPLVQKDCHFVSRSLPRGYKHHDGQFNAKGQPLFDSWKQVDRVTRSANDDGEGVVYE